MEHVLRKVDQGLVLPQLVVDYDEDTMCEQEQSCQHRVMLAW